MSKHIYSDRIVFKTSKFTLRIIRPKKIWQTSELHWILYVIPTIEIEKDYDMYFIKILFLKMKLDIELIVD